MSEIADSSEAFVNHPLGKTIADWAASVDPPAMPFLHPSEFFITMKALDLGEVAEKNVFKTFNQAELVRRAMGLGAYDARDHEVLYRASRHTLGYALIEAAGIAYLNDLLENVFAPSLGQKGFIAALKAWSPNLQAESFVGANELQWIHRNLIAKGHPDADFWEDKVQKSYPNLNDYYAAVAKEVSNAASAKRGEKKRRESGVGKRESAFISRIRMWWVPAGLWMLPYSDIVKVVDPRNEAGISDPVERVRLDIINLEYASSHRGRVAR